MRGKILSKLKSISISTPNWSPGLVFQPNTALQQTSNLPQKQNNHNLPTLTKEEKTDSVLMHDDDEAKSTADIDPSLQISTSEPLISDFDEKCPPGGKDILVLYTTSLRGIRKTFEDCNAIRFLLESFRVSYSERDVSLHLEYRHELWDVLGGRVVPPRLFIRGRYIGGADEVVGLHENGMLKNLLRGLPLSLSNRVCGGCGGMRFVLCLGCNGSRKVVVSENGGLSVVRCPDCNENGLVKCLVCS
ncbi:hypothetical protein DH2020_014868 [Rehmannia glutinosa]|uniref:Glutaredoxin domain-containing protein n=1 Tax=Rehmannia glutinosa TaxID=99300 RepID=A0ABR0WXN9_REHGL